MVAIVTLLLVLAPATQGDAAKEAFESASAHFEAQRFAEAREQFVSAVELSGRRPAAVFGLAQCERALGHYDDAIVLFREYLASNPPNIAEVLRTIEILEAAIVLVERSPPPAESMLTEPWLWIAVGATVAGGVIAAAVMATSEPDLYGGNAEVVLRP